MFATMIINLSFLHFVLLKYMSSEHVKL